MNERTRAYLRGRFRDYYRRVTPSMPPDPERREWGYIPFTDSPGTTMVRHKSLLDLGDLGAFLQRTRPRHVYFSAGQYDEPGASTMDAKGWRGSDLIFDLDADHLPGIDPDEVAYPDMLAACKDELTRLLSILREDFGFDQPTIVFSGGRGYHVHVREEAVRTLSREARREVVDYVRGNDVAFDDLIRTETVAGSFGRSPPAEIRPLPPEGGWGGRIHQRLLRELDDLRGMPEEAAIERLREIDGVGEDRARKVLRAAHDSRDAIAAGTVDVNDGVLRLARHLADQVVAEEGAAIDEPVTTDTHRLIRLPGSLHGGTALAVTPIGPGELDDFDPLVDAIPEPFVGHEVTVSGDGGPPVTLNGETFTVPDSVTTLPEYVAMFLMARGRAEKEREQ